MKKKILLFMITAFVCSGLCGCGSKVQVSDGNSGGPHNTEVQNSEVQNFNTQNTNAQNTGVQNTDAQNTNSQNPGDNHASSGRGSLQLLSNRYGESACNTENGYYYLTFETARLQDGNYGMHLMYMDFASGREIYLCSTAGCKHDSADCPSVFLYDDFPPASTLLFVFKDNLYILSREYDDDGSMSQQVVTFGSDDTSVKSRPAVLYRANPDGTERRKVYTFDADLTLEDKVIGSDNGIYVVTKKLSADKDGDQTYTVSSERKLMFLNLESLSLSEVCQMDFGDNISWQIIGCSQNDFLLCGTDFGRKISRDETWNDDVYRDLYENSFEVYALLNQSGDKPREIARLSNKYYNSVKLLGDSLYVSTNKNQSIEEVNIRTGEKKTLCSLPQNLIMDTLGDTLCCRDWNLAGDPIWYFVNTKTGEITHSPLVILCNGWSIEFRGEMTDDVIFVYDYNATDNHDGSYEIHQYKHALISKEDLFAGKENYRRIEMVGPGY